MDLTVEKRERRNKTAQRMRGDRMSQVVFFVILSIVVLDAVRY